MDELRELVKRLRMRGSLVGTDAYLEGIATGNREAADTLAATLDRYEGWVMVPRGATRSMIDAAIATEEDGYWMMWEAMIAAAPKEVEGE